MTFGARAVIDARVPAVSFPPLSDTVLAIAPLPSVPAPDIPVTSTMFTHRFVTVTPPKLIVTACVEVPDDFFARNNVSRRLLLSTVVTCTHVSPQPVTVGVGPGEFAFA